MPTPFKAERQKIIDQMDKVCEQHTKEPLDNIEDTLKILLRNIDFPTCSAMISDNVLAPEVLLLDGKSLQLDILRQKLVDLHVRTIEEIREAIDGIISEIPNNIYNIKETLESFERKLDPFYPNNIQFICSSIRHQIDRRCFATQALFTSSDLREEYQKGFEEGYKKCLKVKENVKDISDRFRKIGEE